MKTIALKKPTKDQRERLILLGLVELYLEHGKPIGSNTLKENGFEALSSATIRNYFSKLEEAGYLKQQHSSGGRIPTHLAYKVYAEEYLQSPLIQEKDRQQLHNLLIKEGREIATYLSGAAEVISETTKCAVFLSAPRFDHDFVLDIKIIGIDQNRCLCVLVTDFGLVHTEVLYTDKKLSSFNLKRIEAYFHFKLTSLDKPDLSEMEEAIATRFYNEVMLRHIVSYTNFTAEDIYKTGFSKLLSYPDFNDASALAAGLSLFESLPSLRTLLRECNNAGHLCCWIGDDLDIPSCSVIAAPYKINHSPVGAIAILGPNRINYKRLFGILQTAADCISVSLTRSIYKFKIAFRKPQDINHPFLDKASNLLLEDKTI
ncbi:MAG: heat-inducible transcriptional repressor HrcA [Chlamydiota bacterium]